MAMWNRNVQNRGEFSGVVRPVIVIVAPNYANNLVQLNCFYYIFNNSDGEYL